MSWDDAEDGFDHTGDTSLTDDADAETGEGGDVMAFYDADRIEILRTIGGTPFVNESDEELPSGFTDDPNNSFDHGMQESGPDCEREPERDEDAEEGEGGEVMEVWADGRRAIVEMVSGAEYANEAEFPVPPAFVDSPNQPFGYGFQSGEGEKGLGINVTWQVTDMVGNLVDGQGFIQEDGETIGGSAEVGFAIASFHPPSGAIEGADGDERGEITFQFEPNVDGVAYDAGEIEYPAGSHFDINYSAIHGFVTDVEGIPVEETAIFAENTVGITDQDGYYNLIAPADTSVMLSGLEQSLDRGITTDPDEPTRQDWQFGGIEVRVVFPDGSPAVGVPVTIDGSEFETDEQGIVSLTTASFEEHDVSVMDFYEEEVNITFEGQLESILVDEVAGARIEVNDLVTGEAVKRVYALEEEIGIFSSSGETGDIAILTPTHGEFTFVIGDDDPRYKTSQVHVTLDEDELAELEAELERQVAISDF